VQVDGFTHLYTLILRPDLSYEVKIDGQSIESGSIEYDWNVTSLNTAEKLSAEAQGWDQAKDAKAQVWVSLSTGERACGTRRVFESPGMAQRLYTWRCHGILRD
jgi:hypothetical protein